MKKLLFAMFVALLMAGCGGETKKPGGDSPESNQSSGEVAKINLDDPETRKKIIAEAIGGNKLQLRDNKGDELAYAPNEQKTYSGWEKEMHDNGTIWWLSQWKDGKKDGLWTWWHGNGKKSMEQNYKNGKRDGVETDWFENGQKELEANYKDGKQDGLETGWYQNGQKEYEGNWKDGKQDGLWVFYNEDGTEKSRLSFKDGEEVEE
jgi:antitoxin component YwqK of YwqJK toxin-antitoxin module